MAFFNDFREWARYFAAPIRESWDAFIDLLNSSTGQAIKAPYNWSSDVTASDPGSGYVKINNVDPTISDFVYASEINSEGLQESLMLNAIRENDFVGVTGETKDVSYTYQATGPAVDMGGWYSIPVVYVDSTLTTFVQDDDVFLALVIYSANTFLELTDTPGAYTGFEGSTVVVNAAGDALDFGDLAPSVLTWAYRWQTALGPPPTDGHVRGNDADPALITELYISTEDDGGINRSLGLGAPRNGDFCGFLDSNSDKTYTYVVTGTPIPDVTPDPTYYTYPVFNVGVRGIFADNEKGFFTILLAGANEFKELLDTPDTYAGQSDKLVKVKLDETGLEFSGWHVDSATGDLVPVGPYTRPGIGTITHSVAHLGIGKQTAAGVEGVLTDRETADLGGVVLGGIRGEGADPNNPDWNAPVELRGNVAMLMGDQLSAKATGAWTVDHYLKAGPTMVLPDGRIAYPIEVGPTIIYEHTDVGTDNRDVELNNAGPALAIVSVTATADFDAGDTLTIGLQLAELGGRTGEVFIELWVDAVYRGETTYNLGANQNIWWTDSFSLAAAVLTGQVAEVRCYYVETNPNTDIWVLGATRLSEVGLYKASSGGGGGGTTFTALTDTPGSYSGQALRVVSVNAGATGLVFDGDKEIVGRLDVGSATPDRANKLDVYGGSICIANGWSYSVLAPNDVQVGVLRCQAGTYICEIGSNSLRTDIRGTQTRPDYKGEELALLSDVGGGAVGTKQVDVDSNSIGGGTWTTVKSYTGRWELNKVTAEGGAQLGMRITVDGVIVIETTTNFWTGGGPYYMLGPGAAYYPSPVYSTSSLVLEIWSNLVNPILTSAQEIG